MMPQSAATNAKVKRRIENTRRSALRLERRFVFMGLGFRLVDWIPGRHHQGDRWKP
jgi:hypothetical protein